MNWINNVVRPKIRGFLRRETPENLWIKCPETGSLVFYKDVEANQFVIPSSGYHMRISAPLRLKGTFDNGEYEDIALPEVQIDPLKFRDERRYADRLRDARTKTGFAGRHEARHRPARRSDGDHRRAGFRLHGRFARHGRRRGVRRRLRRPPCKRETPFIMFAASGGARMQEGILSLMQLPRTTVGGADAARSQAALYRRADKSDYRRRHRVLCDARRRPYRRARRR